MSKNQFIFTVEGFLDIISVKEILKELKEKTNEGFYDFILDFQALEGAHFEAVKDLTKSVQLENLSVRIVKIPETTGLLFQMLDFGLENRSISLPNSDKS